jgi:hypothetical protein
VRAAAPKQASAGGAAKASAKSPPTSGGVPGKDRLALRVDGLRITDSEFGLEDRTKDPPYRVYIDQRNSGSTATAASTLPRPRTPS